MELLTLVADVSEPPPRGRPLPAPYRMGAAERSDIAELGRLYFAAYEPGVACATVEEAIADIRASFDGAYGPLWRDASPVAVGEDGPVSAVLTVHRAPWDDVPDCPFIIETFTARGHRRRGLARGLLTEVLAEVSSSDDDAVALRVDAENTAAAALYRSLGFRER